jgi:AmmeMemoRadiSam system protein B
MLKSYIRIYEKKEPAISIICPHAGYVYSGKVAGSVYGKISIPDDIIILGPNHHEYGEPFAIMKEGVWQTPLGNVEINKPLAETIIEKSRYIHENNLAHIQEHSIEVQVPFLQYIKDDIKIVPITLSGPLESTAWPEIGIAISEAITDYGKNVLIVASSDFTHYETQSKAEENDRYAIEAIIAMNEDLFIERIAERDISICGFAPIITAMIASKNLGAKSSELVEYRTSGDVSKDYEQVVGYAGILIK